MFFFRPIDFGRRRIQIDIFPCPDKMKLSDRNKNNHRTGGADEYQRVRP